MFLQRTFFLKGCMSDKINLKLLLILKRYSAGIGEGERGVIFLKKSIQKNPHDLMKSSL